jgi:hypothetical protein
MYKDNLILIDKMLDIIKEMKEEHNLYRENIKKAKDSAIKLINMPSYMKEY